MRKRKAEEEDKEDEEEDEDDDDANLLLLSYKGSTQYNVHSQSLTIDTHEV